MTRTMVAFLVMLLLIPSTDLISQDPAEFIQEHPGIVAAGIMGTLGAVYGSYKLYKMLSWHWIQRKSPHVLLHDAYQVYHEVQEEYQDELTRLKEHRDVLPRQYEKLGKYIKVVIYEKLHHKRYPLISWCEGIKAHQAALEWQVDILSYKFHHYPAQFDDNSHRSYTTCIQELLALQDHLAVIKKVIQQSTAYKIELLERRIEQLTYARIHNHCKQPHYYQPHCHRTAC